MTEISLKPVTYENIEDVFALEVTVAQQHFVASTCKSLAYAYVKRDVTDPFGIYFKNQLIGYVSIIFDEEDQMYNIWHFLIDQKFQGKGYSKPALLETLKIIKEKAKGKTDTVALGVEKENSLAKKLYKSVGFLETGEFDDGEEVLMMKF